MPSFIKQRLRVCAFAAALAAVFSGAIGGSAAATDRALTKDPASEPTLQAIFDDHFGAGCVDTGTETGGETLPPGVYHFDLIAVHTCCPGNLGWYPLTDPSQFNLLLGDSPGSKATVTFNEPVGLKYSVGPWHSHPGLNADGFDHFVTFDVCDQVGGGVAAGIEDNAGGGDRDFNDYVFTFFAVPFPSLDAIFTNQWGPNCVDTRFETGAEAFHPGTYDFMLVGRFKSFTNVLGWYPTSDPSQFHVIFDQTDGSKTFKQLRICSEFGLRLITAETGDEWSSQASLNSDGFDHFVTFDICPAVGNGVAVGIEDLSGGGDQDFDDFVMGLRPANLAPVCNRAAALPPILWSPNHRMTPIQIVNVEDPEGDPLTITVTGVTQDEPVNGIGDGNSCPDAQFSGSDVQVRAERSGRRNGRVYNISFTASDGNCSCEGVVQVCVPHDQSGRPCRDDGQIYNSAAACVPTATLGTEELGVKVLGAQGDVTTFAYTLPAESDVLLAVYDIAGRRIATLENSRLPAGSYEVSWNTANLSRGIYFYRLIAGDAPVITGRTFVR